MAETIRDVIIRIAIEQKNAKLQVPDFSPIEAAVQKSAETQSKAFTSAFKSANSGKGSGIAAAMRSQIEEAESLTPALDAAVNQHLEILKMSNTEENRLLAEQAIAYRDSVREIIEAKKTELKTLEEAESRKQAIMTQSSARLKEITISEKIAAFERRKAAEALKDANAEAVRNQALINRIAGDMRSAGEGAFRAARGIALWTADSDEQLQKMIKNVAAVQGAWDIVSGSMNVLRGVTSAYTAVTAAGGVYVVVQKLVAKGNLEVASSAAAATTATTALAAAQTAGSSTGKAAAASTGLLTKAFTPLGAIIVSIVAALGTGWWAMRKFSEEEENAAKNAEPILNRFRKLREELSGMKTFEGHLGVHEQIMALNDQMSPASRLVELENRRLVIAQKLQEIDANRLLQLARTGNADEREVALKMLQEFDSLNDRLTATEKEKIDALRAQGAALQENLKSTEDIAKAAKDALQAEKDRVAGVQRSLGAMDPLKKAELKRYGEIIKSGGVLNDSQLARLDQGFRGLSPVAEFVDRQYVAKGRGQENILAPFNGGQNLSGVGSDLQALQRTSDEAGARFLEEFKLTMQMMAQNKAEIYNEMQSVVAKIRERFASKDETRQLQETLSEMDRRSHERDVRHRGY